MAKQKIKSILLEPGAATLPNSSFAELEKKSGTNVIYWRAKFDKDADEALWFKFRMDDQYDGGTIAVKCLWVADTATSGDVEWAVTIKGIADDEAWDAAGTKTNFDALTTSGTAGQINTSSKDISSPGLSAGDIIHMKLERDVSEDDMAEDAILLQCIIEYSVNVNELDDADADTKIQLEESADEDKIRFDTGGTERAVIDSNGLKLASGADVNEFSTDGTLADNSDDAVPTEKAVKTYVDTNRMPQRATLWHDEATVISGSAISLYQDTTQVYNNTPLQTSHSNGDSFSHSLFLKAGTYTFAVLGVTTTIGGILDWTLDGTSILAGQDWYSVADAKNVIKTTTGISISTDGYHKLVGTVNGKNASSGNYYIFLTKYWFKPASDPART